jgi:hypothetical protein
MSAFGWLIGGALITLLRIARHLSWLWPRHPRAPRPGRAHSHLCAAILLYELQRAETATSRSWTATASSHLDRAIAAAEEVA